nr:hypothetical protein CDL15_Pgr019682 [Ipomoea batatas]GMD85606.1 hypothetical protein CDL15_Pgr019682 [Ipomoea batatas]GME14635.1 hypothetical protein CDL15_Pgr019682 [Ipomoea batatas]
MRVSDILTANWKFLWAINIIIFKMLQWLGTFSILQTNLFPKLTLLLVSATSTFLLVVLGLMFDIMAKLRRQPSNVVGRKICKGGICWHDCSHVCIVYD